MFLPISRRRFFGQSLAVSAGTVLARTLRLEAAARRGGPAAPPLFATSHTNETGHRAAEEAWAILAAGGRAVDAVERAANIIEVDPEDTSVGYGGLPNEAGVVQLDASIMDGRTYNAGAVGALEGIKTPSSVARLVMDRTDHIFLVGRGALEFALSWGFKKENLLTDKARTEWLKWRESKSDSDDWGPPDHLKDLPDTGIPAEPEVHHGTVNCLAVDAAGDIAGVTTTSGLSYKIPGRVGDSPIIGAGLYVDNDVGAAGCTGRGEDVMKSCASYFIIERMRAGRSPQQACEDALDMIRRRYARVNPAFMPGEKFVAISRQGEYGCAWSLTHGRPSMTIRTDTGLQTYDGTSFES